MSLCERSSLADIPKGFQQDIISLVLKTSDTLRSSESLKVISRLGGLLVLVRLGGGEDPVPELSPLLTSCRLFPGPLLGMDLSPGES